MSEFVSVENETPPCMYIYLVHTYIYGRNLVREGRVDGLKYLTNSEHGFAPQCCSGFSVRLYGGMALVYVQLNIYIYIYIILALYRNDLRMALDNDDDGFRNGFRNSYGERLC